MIVKPMLARSVQNLDTLKYPLICTPKIDGIRCLKIDGQVVSRTLKPIPNHHIRHTLQSILPDWADGELVSGQSFYTSSSKIMRKDGTPDFKYCIFDIVNNPHDYYVERLMHLIEWYSNECTDIEHIQLVPTHIVDNQDDLIQYERRCIDAGYEGIMMRSPTSPYKWGRSTVKEQYLLKLKRFEDSEGEIISVTEARMNMNEPELNVLGLIQRSVSAEHMYPAGYMGSITIRDIHNGVVVNLGTGFDQAQRDEIWAKREDMIGKLVKYKYQPSGTKDKPRFPAFVGFRSRNDLT